LSIIGAKRKLKLKAANEQEYSEWKYGINVMINYANAKCTPGEFSQINAMKPWKMNQITETEFLKTADTGDFLLFQTYNLKAKLQQSVTFTNYDHVRMILKLDNVIYIFDANGNRGVSMTTWDDIIDLGMHKNYSKIVYRKLEMKRLSQDIEDNFLGFVLL